jgi:ABC-type nitrate/sulfonate/bicarbonate transport system substrate-binding protein
VQKSRFFLSLTACLFCLTASALRGQTLEKALITHQSESIGIAPLIYGIEKGFYRREGVDLQFRILRSDLAVSAIVGSREVDYMYGAGTAFRAGAKGLPVRILSHDIKSVLHYLMVLPSVHSAKDLKGKKVAVGSLGGTNMAAARASLKALGLDPDKDVTYIVIGAASVRMAAMESGSVQASMMPAPWNARMKQKGFKEMMFAGDVISDPLNGIVTSKEKLEKNSEQVKKVLRGFLRALKAVRTEKRDVSEFMAAKYNLDLGTAEEVYGTFIQTLTEDGTVSDQLLQEQLEQFKKEGGGIKKDVVIGQIVDYRLVREIGSELARSNR